jgi:hypothetical protein
MMLFGKPIDKLDAPGIELSEVTLQASPDVLRLIAQFLARMADEMEAGAFAKCSHMHLSSLSDPWFQDFPDRDIIVMPPIISQPPTVSPSDSNANEPG